MRDIVLASLMGSVSAVVLLACIKAMAPPSITLPQEQWTCTRFERVYSAAISMPAQSTVQLQPKDHCVVYERIGWR